MYIHLELSTPEAPARNGGLDGAQKGFEIWPQSTAHSPAAMTRLLLQFSQAPFHLPPKCCGSCQRSRRVPRVRSWSPTVRALGTEGRRTSRPGRTASTLSPRLRTTTGPLKYFPATSRRSRHGESAETRSWECPAEWSTQHSLASPDFLTHARQHQNLHPTPILFPSFQPTPSCAHSTRYPFAHAHPLLRPAIHHRSPSTHVHSTPSGRTAGRRPCCLLRCPSPAYPSASWCRSR